MPALPETQSFPQVWPHVRRQSRKIQGCFASLSMTDWPFPAACTDGVCNSPVNICYLVSPGSVARANAAGANLLMASPISFSHLALSS